MTTAKSSRWWLAVAASAILLIGTIGGWAVSRVVQPAIVDPVLRLQIDPPDGGRFVFGTNVGGIALSPDGKTAAYVASANGKVGLCVRPLDGSAARLLPGTEGAIGYPFWSPDSKSLGFFTAGELQRVELAGGRPLTICPVAAGRSGAWTNEGRILLGVGNAGLLEVSASGGTPSPLTIVDRARGEASHRWPQFLPGDRFLYWVQGEAAVQGVYAASLLRPRERVRLVVADSNALYASGSNGLDYLLFSRGGTLMVQEFDLATPAITGEPHPLADSVGGVGLQGQMAVAASTTGLLLYSASNTSGQFGWFDRSGKPLGTVGEPSDYGVFRLSPDGQRVGAHRERPGGTDIWVLEVARGVPSRFTFDSPLSSYPVWSPDGRTILFTAGSSRNLFRKDAGGTDVASHRVTQSQNGQFPTDWSRDGRWVLFYELATGTLRDLWIVPTTPEAPEVKPQLYLRTTFTESWGRFSPEPSPRWVAYQSDESGRYEVYIDAFPQPRGKIRISTDGGSYPQWGAGGRELFYVSPNYQLMSVSLKLEADSIAPSAPRELFALPAAEIGYSPYDTAPDGQRFLVRATPERQAAQPLTVIVNWPALLKK